MTLFYNYSTKFGVEMSSIASSFFILLNNTKEYSA